MLRISAIILTVLISFQLQAQENIHNKVITLHVETLPLKEVIQLLSNDYSIHFFYSPSKIDDNKPVTIHLESVPLMDILDKLCDQAGISYKIKGDEVILYPSGKNQNQPWFTISGFVSDSSSGERLIGANIIIAELSEGTVTNGYGYFSYSLPGGQYKIRCSFIGYFIFEQILYLIDNSTITIKLIPELIPIKEVELKKSSIDKINSVKLGHDELPLPLLRKYPSMMGENDVVQFLKMLPGIQSSTDGFNGLYIRGSTPQQTSFILDDAPLFNIYHISGWFSTINPDALKGVEIYKSQLPARSGGALSSIVNIYLRDGNNQNFGVTGGIGTLTSRITIEGPIIKNKSSFIFSARRSYLDQLGKLFNLDEDIGINHLYFYDLNGKINYSLNRKNRLYLSSLISYDKLYEENGVKWKNQLFAFRWNHLFGNNLFSNLSLSASNYIHQFSGYDEDKDKYILSAGIKNYTFKYDLSWYTGKNQKINFGTNNSFQTMLPMRNIDPHSQLLKFPEWLDSYHRIIYNLYIEGDFALSKKLNLESGIRLSALHNLTINKPKFIVNPEPSVRLQYKLKKETSVKAAYSRNYQYHHGANVFDLFIPFELFIFTNESLKPQYADHFSMGFISSLGKSGMEFSCEPYLSLMKNQYRFLIRNELLFGDNYEESIIHGKSNAYGVELSLRNTLGKLTGQVSYTWSKIEKKEDNIHKGAIYNPAYDRRNDIAININYELSKRVTLSANWIFMSGNPYNQPYSKYEIRGRTVLLYDTLTMYNSRMPDYHRLDIGCRIKLGKSEKMKHSLSFSVYNAYGRKNSLFYYYSDVTPDGSIEKVNDAADKQFKMFDFFGFQFFPAFSYEFSF